MDKMSELDGRIEKWRSQFQMFADHPVLSRTPASALDLLVSADSLLRDSQREVTMDEKEVFDAGWDAAAGIFAYPPKARDDDYKQEAWEDYCKARDAVEPLRWREGVMPEVPND